MFGFGNSARIEILLTMIEEQNKIIGDLQEKVDELKRQIDEIDVYEQVENALNGVDLEDMARNAIDDCIGNASLSIRF